METINLLPTWGKKGKVSQSWGYPVGAKIVSQALAGISQYQYTHLYFYSSTIDAKQLEPIQVLGVSYVAPWMKTSESWSVSIYAVPKSATAQVKELLISEGLPHIRSWIEAKHTPIEMSRSRHLFIRFDLNSQSLVFTERNAW